MDSETFTMPPFPPRVRLEIQVVFPGEYCIGYRFEHIHYVPGTPSYYPLQEALDRCYKAFRDSFPDEGESTP